MVLQLECKYEYEEVNWESIKESTYCVHISKIVKKITSLQMQFCFAALEFHLGTRQLLRFLPREICIFSNVRRQIIAESKFP